LGQQNETKTSNNAYYSEADVAKSAE